MKTYLRKSAFPAGAAADGRCPMRGELFDPFDLRDPFPSYQRWRGEAPVFYDETIGYWIVSRHADIRAVFEDWRNFSSENAQAPVRGCKAGAAEGGLHRLFRPFGPGTAGPYSHSQGGDRRF